MFKVYILISKIKNRYYIGMTSDSIEERIRRHNSNHKGFTGKQSDWTLVYSESFLEKSDASFREKEIKNWKSRIMIEKIIYLSGA